MVKCDIAENIYRVIWMIIYLFSPDMYCKLQLQEFASLEFLGILWVGNPDKPFTYVYTTGCLNIFLGAGFLDFLFSFVLLQLWDLVFKFKLINSFLMLSADIEWECLGLD